MIHYDKGTQGSKTVVFGTRLECLIKASELLLIGFLRSSPLWSFQKFASGRLATPGSTSLNVTFASA